MIKEDEFVIEVELVLTSWKINIKLDNSHPFYNPI